MDAPPASTQHNPPVATQLTSTSSLSSQSSSSSSSSFQLLDLLPLPLLALAASHLEVVSLLRLQCLSSALHRLRNDESYMAAAWRWAKLYLSTDAKLHEWTLPVNQCIKRHRAPAIAAVATKEEEDEEKLLEEEEEEEEEEVEEEPLEDYLIPAGVWRAALPVFHAMIACDPANAWQWYRYQRLRSLVQQPQPMVSVLARCGQDGRWTAVDDASAAETSADVQQVEVLGDVQWRQMVDTMPNERDVDRRCRLVLQACPYLQHLDLTVNPITYAAPSHDDTFALVLRLRSLHLEHSDWNEWDRTSLFDFPTMLSSLPHLTSFSCISIRYLVTTELLDLASHSTLESINIDSGECGLVEFVWLGHGIEFPISVSEDVAEVVRTAECELRGDIEEDDSEAMEAVADFNSNTTAKLEGSAEERKQRDELNAAMQRMQTALTRTQPTEHSCEVRLALAGWLHRRLRRVKLRTDGYGLDPDRPAALSQLHFFLAQVALLRSTLRRQLGEVTVAVAAAELTEASEPRRMNKRARVSGM